MDKQLLLAALDAFKEWSNYLLVTTVAALGWASTSVKFDSSKVRTTVIGSLTASIVFGILTLSLVPIVAQNITAQTTSIYDVTGSYRALWMWWEAEGIRIKWVCWPQHVLFLIGIVTYGVAAGRGSISKAAG